MIYMLGSKMFKAVVLGAAAGVTSVAAHESCCGHKKNETHSGAHDLADAGEDFGDDAGEMGGMGGMGDMNIEEMLKNMNLGDMDMDALKNMDFSNMDMGNNSAPAPQEPEQPEEAIEPPTEEEFNKIKESLKLSDEDVEMIESYVARIPAELKDEKFDDATIARMFVRHYDEAPQPEKGEYGPKGRDDLLDEIKHLVEVEIPQMMGQMPPQKSLEQELDEMDDSDDAELDALDAPDAIKEPLGMSPAGFAPIKGLNMTPIQQTSPVRNEL